MGDCFYDAPVRPLETIALPAGDAVLVALPALSRALAGDSPALLPVPGADTGTTRRYADAFAAGTPLAAAEDRAGDPTGFVVATSGSSADPKGTLLPASALRASAAATAERLGGPGSWLLALPPWHVAGLQVLLRSILAGTQPAVLDLDTPFTAERFAAAAACCTGERRYVSLVPTQLRRIIDHGGEPLAALADFDAVLVGAAATPSGLRIRAERSGVRIVTTYGMTETCGGCVYDGSPLSTADITLDGAGRISLGGPVVARGYRGRSALTATAFVDGRFRTGDLGRLAPDGRLSVLGRADDMIVTGGVNVAPREVEELLAGHPGVSDVAVFGVPDEQWGQRVVAVVVARDPRDPPTLGALRSYVTARAVAPLAPRQVVHVDAIPRLTTGKPDRAALHRLTAGAALPSPRVGGLGPRRG